MEKSLQNILDQIDQHFDTLITTIEETFQPGEESGIYEIHHIIANIQKIQKELRFHLQLPLSETRFVLYRYLKSSVEHLINLPDVLSRLSPIETMLILQPPLDAIGKLVESLGTFTYEEREETREEEGSTFIETYEWVDGLKYEYENVP